MEQRKLLLVDDTTGEVRDQSMDGMLKSPHNTSGVQLSRMDANEQLRLSKTSTGDPGE